MNILNRKMVRGAQFIPDLGIFIIFNSRTTQLSTTFQSCQRDRNVYPFDYPGQVAIGGSYLDIGMGGYLEGLRLWSTQFHKVSENICNNLNSQ